MNGKFIPNGTEFYYEEPSRARITYSDGETLFPGDGSEYALAVFGLDRKDARDLICMDFSMEPALYAQTGCTLLVKAAFGSDEFPHG